MPTPGWNNCFNPYRPYNRYVRIGVSLASSQRGVAVKATRRELIAVGLLLALLACQVLGSLHLGHNHETSQPSNNRTACVLSHSPSIHAEGPVVVTTMLVTRHTTPDVPLVFISYAWQLLCSPRSPPASDIA